MKFWFLIKEFSKLSIAFCFWPRFMRDELGLQFTDRKKMQLTRALQVCATRKLQGCKTSAVLRDMRSGCSKRSSGAADNSTKFYCYAVGGRCTVGLCSSGHLHRG